MKYFLNNILGLQTEHQSKLKGMSFWENRHYLTNVISNSSFNLLIETSDGLIWKIRYAMEVVCRIPPPIVHSSKPSFSPYEILSHPF